MHYRITHTTTYKYSSPVSVCHNVVILAPRRSKRVLCTSHRMTIRPNPEVCERRKDMFGNEITRFSLEENHSQLVITAVSKVTVVPRELAADIPSPTCAELATSIANRTDPDWLEVVPFTFNSERIQKSPEFSRFAADVMLDNIPILTAATALTQKIYTDFNYDKNATSVDTPTETAFAGRHGVCQDFAHIAVACLRSINLPARYVSGYLRTIPPEGKERLIGADQSHAWFSVYCGPALGWVDFDPTNNCLCGGDHIAIAIGRDYSDVVPIKGVFLGGGEPVLSVSVDVAPE